MYKLKNNHKEKNYNNENAILPIYEAKEKILCGVESNDILIVIGDTGSGKTTQITQFIYQKFDSNILRICCTQPRRIAAMSISKKVSKDLNCKLGNIVGYSVRFENLSDMDTKIKYVTEGILIKQLSADFLIKEYSYIIIDEAHERTINTDILLGILKEVVKIRSSFKLIVMSATLEIDKFYNFYWQASTILVPGRLYPVEIFYSKKILINYLVSSLKLIMNIVNSTLSGDVLVFLSGEDEIENLCYSVKKITNININEIDINPLYANLSMKYQDKIFKITHILQKRKIKKLRKVIVSTNIAETSVTLENISFVIDCGFSKKKIFNPRMRIDSLLSSPISKASAHQRSGRAGRTKIGTCFRMYTEFVFNEILSYQSYPEIIRSNLDSTILIFKRMGIRKIINFDFIDPPSPEILMRGLEKLYQLNSLDQHGNLTDLGFLVSEIPLETQAAKSIIESFNNNTFHEILSIFSMITSNFYLKKIEDINSNEKKIIFSKFCNFISDHLTLLNIFNTWRIKKRSSVWAAKNLLNYKLLEACDKIREQLLKICIKLNIEYTFRSRVDLDFSSNIIKSIFNGYFLNTACYKNGDYHTNVHIESLIKDNKKSVLFNSLILTKKLYMYIVTNIPINWFVIKNNK
ncbi:splicing factor Prp43 (nucleomorph) [Lotharella oceanica]|uniref:RNA helicase n=1 Tax=Lotharella oceanica TaxID=641309 RepID=A0A060D7R9_9EUKA|nr:splicing factor Prp43 [Lotharella oceanica]